MIQIHRVILIFLVILLASCSPERYKDVTHLENFREKVGVVYETRQDIYAIGVTLDPNYKKIVDYVAIVRPPGFSGPEVVFREKITEEVRFKVKAVLLNEGLIDTYYYLIEVLSGANFDNHAVVVRLEDDVNSKNNGLNTEAFVLVDAGPNNR